MNTKKNVTETLWKDEAFVAAGVSCGKAAKAILKCANILLVPGVSVTTVECALYTLLSAFCVPNNITAVIHEKMSILLLHRSQEKVVSELIGMMRECLAPKRNYRFKVPAADVPVNITLLKKLTGNDAFFARAGAATVDSNETPQKDNVVTSAELPAETKDVTNWFSPTKVDLNPLYDPVIAKKARHAVLANADCDGGNVRLDTLFPNEKYRKAMLRCVDPDLDTRILMSFGDNPTKHKKFEDLPEIEGYTPNDADYSFVDPEKSVPTKYSSVPQPGPNRLNVMDLINGDVQNTSVENITALLPVILRDSYFSNQLVDRLLSHHKIDTADIVRDYLKHPGATKERTEILLKHTTAQIVIPDSYTTKWQKDSDIPVVLLPETPKKPDTATPAEFDELEVEDYLSLANQSELKNVKSDRIPEFKSNWTQASVPRDFYKFTPENASTFTPVSGNLVLHKGGDVLGMTPLAEAYPGYKDAPKKVFISPVSTVSPVYTPIPLETPEYITQKTPEQIVQAVPVIQASKPEDPNYIACLLKRIDTLESELTRIMAKLTSA